MRILGFSKRWPKLSNPVFTTFRYPRVDKDWYEGEVVQVFHKNRSPQREKLGIVEIICKEPIDLDPDFNGKPYRLITEYEAIADGFESRENMVQFMEKQYGLDYISCMNKLTLKWLG